MAADVDTLDSLFERYGNVYRWLVTLTVMIGAIAMGFATSMVNVAVPAVMGAYGVGLDQAQWMATGFLATMSTTMLLSSWLITQPTAPYQSLLGAKQKRKMTFLFSPLILLAL